MAVKFIFTYGSLLSDFDNPAHDLLKEHAKRIGKAIFRGRLYMVDWYPGVVASDNPDDKVHGEVYSIENRNTLLKELDRYEGCSPSDPQPHQFERQEHTVTLQNGEELLAWIYIYIQPVPVEKRIPSGDYLHFKRNE